MTHPSYRGRAGLAVAALCLLAAAAAVLLGYSFAPGGMNPDAVHQLRQVLGDEPVGDWHPPVLVVVWKVLMLLSGEISALMWAQIALWAACAIGLGVYLYDLTARIPVMFLGLGVLLLPHVVALVGDVWKDTSMMLSFLTAAVAVLLATRFPRLRIALLILAFAALVYGTMVRKNAVFATLPMLLWMIHVWRPRILRGAGLGRRLGALAVVAAVFGGTIAVADAAISARYDVRHDSQITQVMLDDLVFTVPAAQIEQHVDNPVIREHLLNAQRVCAEKDVIWDAYWACYGKGEFGSYTSIEDSEEIPGYWTQLVLTRPDRYLEYRLTTYSEFLFRNDLFFLSDFHRNQYGLDYHSPQLQRMLQNYVLHFGQAQLPWLFACWFWLLVSVLGLALWRTWRRWGIASPVTALAGSSLIYLLGYFPVVPAANYRYYYWPAVAGTLILLLIGIAAVRVRAQRRQERTVGPAGAADAESAADSGAAADSRSAADTGESADSQSAADTGVAADSRTAADTQSVGSTQQPSSARHSGAAARRESAAQPAPAAQSLRRHRDR